MSTETARLWDIVEPYLAAEQVELDDLDVHGKGRGRILRVTVDAEGGVDVDRIADLSRGLSRMLDEQDVLADGYTLEVSSPGLERALRRPAHYQKVVGAEIVAKTENPVDGARSHRGILRSAEADELVMTVDGVDRRIPFEEITKARTVFTWERAPRPGRK